MKKFFAKVRDLAEGKLRGLCGVPGPEKRVATIVVLAALFAVGNFYMIFRTVYDIGAYRLACLLVIDNTVQSRIRSVVIVKSVQVAGCGKQPRR